MRFEVPVTASHSLASTEALGLVRKLRLLGTALVVALAVLTVCSYALTQYAPREQPQAGKIALLTRWIAALPISPDVADQIEEGVTAGGWFGRRPERVAVFILPMLIATLATLSATWLLIRSDAVPKVALRTIHRTGTIAALIILPAYPIFTQDFWLSAVWGRMVLNGVNPYAVLADSTVLAGLPNTPPGLTMTYGPLWAFIAGGIALVGQGVPVVEFVASKLVLVATWLMTLALLRRVAERRSTRDAAISLCLMAWLPGPLWMSLGEGHNDIVMVMFLVLWLALVTGRRPLVGPLALVGATAVKYVAAPLMAVDAIYIFLTRRGAWRAYAATLGLAAVAGLLIFAPFVKTGEFLGPLGHMRGWVFWTPATALTEFSGSLGRYIGLPLTVPLVTMGLILVLFSQLRSLWRAPSPDTLIRVALALVVLETFALIGHVWPWFLLWGLPFAVMSWRHWLGQAFLAVIVLSPVLNIAWMVAPDWHYRGPLGVLMYGGALLLTLALAWSPIGRRIRSRTAPEWNTFRQTPTP